MTPTKRFLADAERSMFLLSPDAGRREKLYQMDLERECVIAEWGCQKDGVDVPMSDVVADTKSSQTETGRHTFLGLDDNRLVRWDGARRGRVAQTLASPTLGYRDGHDFARGTKFRCMATTGDGCIAVGSEDGKIRLYGDSSMRQAKTSFPGLGSPITHIDVTYDGKWILATTSTCLRAAAHRDQGFQNWGSHERVQDESRRAHRCAAFAQAETGRRGARAARL